MLIIAHRGAVNEAIENTMDAFKKAVALGADRIELDIQPTKDHALVVFHDENLKRMFGNREKVINLTREELAAFRYPNGEPIVFLDELLEKILPDIELNIEIKDPTEASSQYLWKQLENCSHLDKIIVSSFHPKPLVYLAKHAPNVKLACLLDGKPTWPFVSESLPLVFMQRCGAHIIHPDVDLVDENFVDQCRARGWVIFPYVGYKKEERRKEDLWTYLATLGIEGLCTNFPREFKAWNENLGKPYG
ncbi:MAG: glycerophosphodiester phosphodiesterase [Oligoflexales bacterium]